MRVLRSVGEALGDKDHEHYRELKTGENDLREAMKHQCCLVILDDAWSVRDVEPFVNALGPRCRLIVATREGSLVTALGAQEHRVDILSDADALKLLADCAEKPLESLPDEARRAAKECGNLPFALAVSGAMAQEGTPWADLLKALLEVDLTFLAKRLQSYPYPDVFKALKASVDFLAETDAAAAAHYYELAVFPAERVAETAVLTLWMHTGGLSTKSEPANSLKTPAPQETSCKNSRESRAEPMDGVA